MNRMRIRAAALDVTITSDGPDAGSPEVSAVMAQIRELIAPGPLPVAVGSGRNRRERRAAAAINRRTA